MVTHQYGENYTVNSWNPRSKMFKSFFNIAFCLFWLFVWGFFFFFFWGGGHISWANLMEIFECIIANFWTFTFSTNIQEVLKNQFLYLQLIDQDGMTGLCTNDWQRWGSTCLKSLKVTDSHHEIACCITRRGSNYQQKRQLILTSDYLLNFCMDRKSFQENNL